MGDSKGPITLVTDLSNKRNRWKGLAFAWRSVAISAIPSCTTCGAPSLWKGPKSGLHWCDAHRGNGAHPDETPAKVSWHNALRRAIDLEAQIEQSE